MLRVMMACLPAIQQGMERRAALDTAEPALHIKQHSNGAEPSEICPQCGGKVLINKPSGNGFCLQCDYKVTGKLRHC